MAEKLQTYLNGEVEAVIARIDRAREEDLARSLWRQEESRMVYWTRFDPFVDLRMRWRASLMRHLFHILPGQKILEVGAGNGKFTRELIDVTRGECEITAIVFCAQHQRNIKDTLGNRTAKVIYSESFPGMLKEASFDYIVAHHMLDDASRNNFLFRLKSLLKPGGGLLLFEPNPWNPYYRLRRFLQKLLPRKIKRPNEPVHLNRLQIFSALSEIGYVRINALPYDFLYSPVPKFLLWPAQHLSIILENFPYLRNFAGSLYIWAHRPQNLNCLMVPTDLSSESIFLGRVSFVIPCHNEEMNIVPLVKGINDFYGKYVREIIIVDDNSRDRTFRIGEELAKMDSRIRLIRRSMPNGVGRALREGIKEAKGEYILTMDCDFVHIIPEMRDLFAAVAKGADVAVGSRFSRDSVLINYAFTKIVANRAFHILANLLLGRHFRDISNNLKLFRREVAKGIVIECNDFSANAEIGLKCVLSGYNVAEVPISWVNRSLTMGLSTFRILKTGPNYSRLLLRLVLRRTICRPKGSTHAA